MGDPKKQRKKFSKPSHPWQRERILAEKELSKEYGLNRKYEIWKMNSLLKNFTRQAKNLVTVKSKQIEKERSQLLRKLNSLGLIATTSKIEDVLSLTLKDVMERRLQTLVYRKKISKTPRQARQFIVHRHIALGNNIVTSPSYLVPVEEESSINFADNSILSNPGHPIRAVQEEKEKKPKKARKLYAKEKKKRKQR